MPETSAPTPIVMAWSGGKDSLLALEALLADPRWRVVALVSSVTRDEERVVLYGDLFLADVRAYRDAQCAAIGFSTHYPLWGQDTRALAERFVAGGYAAIVTCVDTTQLDASFAGREFSRAMLDDLPASVDPCGEHGEFHTYVTHAPCFISGIALDLLERTHRRARFAYADLQRLPDPWEYIL